ncbi:type II toxin-antitoxin system death-on-curing family toxin [Lacticaseibacillus zhaodongensis]|uniref:type II toxin-antitoxin system death-on-curing family toxin n=1 Tax=Lacticaseibacillus zhaodongensis TaxID=2668065 RepID=UPI0012D2EAEF|nr:Fic family protein [Lacticaseibacillus zhaodongensis]
MDISDKPQKQLSALMIAIRNEYRAAHPGNYNLFIGIWGDAAKNTYVDIKVNDAIVDTLGLMLSSKIFTLNVDNMKVINTKAEKMFREEYQHGLKDEGTLSAIISNIIYPIFGEWQYPGVVKKATMYWYKIATSQVFFNGNKRTALLSALEMLYMNGFRWIGLDGNALYEISRQIANKEISADDLEKYILKHIGVTYFDSMDDAQHKLDFAFTMPLH